MVVRRRHMRAKSGTRTVLAEMTVRGSADDPPSAGALHERVRGIRSKSFEAMAEPAQAVARSRSWLKVKSSGDDLCDLVRRSVQDVLIGGGLLACLQGHVQGGHDLGSSRVSGQLTIAGGANPAGLWISGAWQVLVRPRFGGSIGRLRVLSSKMARREVGRGQGDVSVFSYCGRSRLQGIVNMVL